MPEVVKFLRLDASVGDATLDGADLWHIDNDLNITLGHPTLGLIWPKVIYRTAQGKPTYLALCWTPRPTEHERAVHLELHPVVTINLLDRIGANLPEDLRSILGSPRQVHPPDLAAIPGRLADFIAASRHFLRIARLLSEDEGPVQDDPGRLFDIPDLVEPIISIVETWYALGFTSGWTRIPALQSVVPGLLRFWGAFRNVAERAGFRPEVKWPDDPDRSHGLFVPTGLRIVTLTRKEMKAIGNAIECVASAVALIPRADSLPGNEPTKKRPFPCSQRSLGKFLNYGNRTGLMDVMKRDGYVESYEPRGSKYWVTLVDPVRHEEAFAQFSPKPKTDKLDLKS